ncbi:MAG: Stearoyl-CoA 9-desaturase [Frankiales bacterium]|nr:Stearoyl-CoA 9-desaturase [Frankiales bacterium]
MAISDIKAYAHLTPADVEALGKELDALRREIEESRGEKDAAYIRRVIKLQRGLEYAGRATLFASLFPPAWIAGTAMLSLSKIIENMEIGHNVIHGQWDWMNDPEIHSSTWEWDNAATSESWKHSHNVVHHTWTNIVGKDRDVGYGLLRVTRDYKWKPKNLAQPAVYTLLALLFEYGIAFHDVDVSAVKKGRKTKERAKEQLRDMRRKIGKQMTKDYLLWPALTGPAFLGTLSANFTANVVRNVWSNAVIFCGHFPDGAEKFTLAEYETETPAEWYLRQMLGSANFNGGKLLTFMSGNLNHQIEHHIFPDLPSNRYAEIAVRVREICDRYEIPYTTGHFLVQYGQTIRTMLKLSLPDSMLKATSDDAPETASEKKWELRAEREKVAA